MGSGLSNTAPAQSLHDFGVGDLVALQHGEGLGRVAWDPDFPPGFVDLVCEVDSHGVTLAVDGSGEQWFHFSEVWLVCRAAPLE